jgi:hypothetical protein
VPCKRAFHRRPRGDRSGCAGLGRRRHCGPVGRDGGLCSIKIKLSSRPKPHNVAPPMIRIDTRVKRSMARTARSCCTDLQVGVPRPRVITQMGETERRQHQSGAVADKVAGETQWGLKPSAPEGGPGVKGGSAPSRTTEGRQPRQIGYASSGDPTGVVLNICRGQRSDVCPLRQGGQLCDASRQRCPSGGSCRSARSSPQPEAERSLIRSDSQAISGSGNQIQHPPDLAPAGGACAAGAAASGRPRRKELI